MEFTVADFLALSEIEGTRIVAGAQGVGRVITRTNIMDNPDTFDWLMPGEFLLSTGYIFKESPEIQRQIVRSLAEINCSGLCIKVKRYLPEIPRCMIEEADRLSFPLIELPFGYSLSTTIALINRKLFHQSDRQMEQTLSIHQEITRTALGSGGLRGIAETLVNLIGDPVLITDSSWNLLSWQDCPESPLPLSRYVNLIKKARLFPGSFTDSLPDNLRHYKKPISRIYEPEEDVSCTCRILPIAAHDYIYGYLVVLETVHPLTELNCVALEQAAVVAALERMRAKEVEQTKLRERKDFFVDLLSGNIESLNAVRSLAELNGLNPERPYRCLLIRYLEDEHRLSVESGPRRNELLRKSERCLTILAQAAETQGLKITMVPWDLRVSVLVELGHKPENEDARVRAMARRVVELLQDVPPVSPVLVVAGKRVSSLPDIYQSFLSARRGIGMAQAMGLSDTAVFMDDFAVYQLLSENVGRDALLQFCDNAIGPLIRFDQENDSQLIPTLGKYFQHNGNISDAAKALYIHRNTYIYRMDKIKALLNFDFHNPQKMLELQLALLIHQFML